MWKPILRHLAPLVGLLAGCSSTPEPPPWQSLFDGQTLAGWRAYGSDGMPTESWAVEEGAIVSKAVPGELVSQSTYENFELEFEWKVTDGANSGVFYRVSEDGEQVHHTGLEYQILDNVGQAGRPLNEQAGACYGVVSAARDHTRAVGEWNNGRIAVRGDAISHRLNGHVVAEFRFGGDDWQRQVASGPLRDLEGLGRTRRGHIALQNYHGHVVAFRNLRIRELTPAH